MAHKTITLTAPAVQTWADGFGVWHAKVTGARYLVARDTAAAALTLEITERNQNDVLTGIQLISIDVDRLTYEFAEDVRDVPRSRAAYATWTPGRGEWTVTAYDDGSRLPLTAEGLHGSAFDPRVVGTVNPALHQVSEILAESGLCTSGPWTDGPATPEMAEWRIALA